VGIEIDGASPLPKNPAVLGIEPQQPLLVARAIADDDHIFGHDG